MADRPTLLFHLSDLHFGVEDGRALAACAEAVQRLRPDALICTGDLTQRATHRQYALAREWFAALGVPVMLAVGNHDMPYYNPLERFREPYKRYHALTGSVASEIELAHAVLVPLDTNVRAQLRFPWSDGVIRRRKLAATLARLEELRCDPRLKIVVCHHPLLPAQESARNPTIRGEMAFAALAKAGAHAVMSGHVHVPFDLTRVRGNRAMRMIGAGTLSTRLRGAMPSWNLVTIADGEIEVETHYPLGQEFMR